MDDPVGPVVVTVEGRHARVELNRPHRHNAVDSATVRALHRTWQELSRRHDVQVVTLTGRGPSLCAGADIDEFRRLASISTSEREAVFNEHVDMLEALGRLPQVTVAVAHGVTAGLGFSLLSRCDIAIAARSARFLLPELTLGVVPALVLVDVQRTMGEKAGKDWLLTGSQRSAAEALQVGLVSRVADDDQLADAVAAIVAGLAAGPPASLRRAIALYHEVAAADCELARRLAVSGSAAAIVSEEAQEGVAAFLERRPPRWPGGEPA